jgi:16S rRNA processing protein RimM
MRKEDCFLLGTVVGKYSYKGELLLKLDTDDPDQYQSIDSLFILHDNGLVPYFIVSSSMHKPGLLRIRLEDVDTEEDANQLIKNKVYLPLSELPELSGNKFYYHEVVGFTVQDKNLGKLGIVTGVNEHTAQATFIVDVHGVSVLIPIVDEFILSVDRSNKTIFVNTPPGLIDLYTKDV